MICWSAEVKLWQDTSYESHVSFTPGSEFSNHTYFLKRTRYIGSFSIRFQNNVRLYNSFFKITIAIVHKARETKRKEITRAQNSKSTTELISKYIKHLRRHTLFHFMNFKIRLWCPFKPVYL